MGLNPKERARFSQYETYLDAHEPGFAVRVDSETSTATIAGRLGVNVGAGIEREFDLEFHFPQMNPFAIPDVWDRVGHFPGGLDRHIIKGPTGWWWCLGLPQAPPVDFTADEPLAPFLGEVRGFIFKQLIYDDRCRAGHPDPWPGAAWGHGLRGHMEWIEEQLGPCDGPMSASLLPFLLDVPLAGNRTCPCGSGKKAGTCHRDAATKVREAAKDTTVRDAIRVYVLIQRVLK
jgi:hypothetical protein